MSESTLPNLRRTSSESTKLLLQAPRHRQLQTVTQSLRVKFVLDVLQRSKILDDDKYVCHVLVEKHWCNQGDERTDVELIVLN